MEKPVELISAAVARAYTKTAHARAPEAHPWVAVVLKQLDTGITWASRSGKRDYAMPLNSTARECPDVMDAIVAAVEERGFKVKVFGRAPSDDGSPSISVSW